MNPCPACQQAPSTHATARPGLRLCADCFAQMLDAVRVGRP